MRYFPVVLAALAALACSSRDSVTEELATRIVLLPGGQEIRAELRTSPAQMKYGLMYRDSLPRGRGMLFVHQKPGPHSYWMHNVRIPLDIVFMSPERKILGIAINAPPCSLEPGQCPTFGGNPNTQYVLELGGGESKRLGLHPGDVLRF